MAHQNIWRLLDIMNSVKSIIATIWTVMDLSFQNGSLNAECRKMGEKKKKKKKWKSSLGATNSVSTLNIITKNFVDALTTFNNPRRSCLITMLWPGLRRIYLSIYFWWTRQMSIQWNKRVWLLLLIFFRMISFKHDVPYKITRQSQNTVVHHSASSRI